MCVKIWREATQNPKQGFYCIVHSGGPKIILPGNSRYRNSSYNNTSYYSCSLLSDKHMDMYNSHLGIEFEYSPESMLCVSESDCATSESHYQNVRTIGKVGENYISAGHTMGDILETRLIVPKTIEKSCVQRANKAYNGILGISNSGENSDSKIINEIVMC